MWNLSLSEDYVNKKKQAAGNSTSARMKRRYGDMRNDYKKKRDNFRCFGIGGMSMCTIHIKGKGVSTHAMKTYGKTEVYIQLFLTLALVEGEKSAARPGRFTSRTFAPHTHWLGGLGGARVSLGAWKNTDLALPGTEPRLVSCSCLYYDMIYDVI